MAISKFGIWYIRIYK